MRLLNLRINFIYCGLFVLILVVFFFFFFFFDVVSPFTTFQPNFTSGLLQVILPQPRIGMMSLVTVFPVITAFHSCCLLHHVFDQVNLWPAWVGFETAIFWQCSPGTVAQRIEALSLYGSRWALSEDSSFKAGQRFTWSKTWCNRQQLWKAVITGNMVTRLIIPIRGCGKITWKRPEVKFGRNVVKGETTQKNPKNNQDEDKKSTINKINSHIWTTYTWFGLVSLFKSNSNLEGYQIYQPLRSGRIWHKVNLWAEFTRFEFSFPSPRLVGSPRLKNLVCPTIYP